ncbi:MAG: Fe-S cluster assembly ATPase SufC, partial [Acidimicrobiia bacterium]
MSDTSPLLQIENLHASAGDTTILKGVNLVVDRGEVHALMGPNGSGKSTLASVLLGHPGYKVTKGRILYKGEDITAAPPSDRGAAGMFLAFQHPEAIPGVSVIQFLRQALSNRTGEDLTVLELRLKVMEVMKELEMESSFADRYLNEGFSGGERKRNEVLQMAVLEPELAIMDETDSGLDIDALRTVADGINRLSTPERGFLIITHYQRLLDYITPDRVHIFVDGRVL